MKQEFDLSLIKSTVVVTRAQEQQGEARILLESMGARVLELPSLIIGPPDNWGPLDDALLAIENFFSAVLAIPSSSIVPTTTAEPYFLAKFKT